MTIDIRNAVADDEPRCVELLAELKSATRSAPARPLQDSFQKLLSKERGEIILAVEGTQILGMATVSYNLAMRYGGEYCQLEELVVTPAARGKNFGGHLVQRILDNAPGTEGLGLSSRHRAVRSPSGSSCLRNKSTVLVAIFPGDMLPSRYQPATPLRALKKVRRNSFRSVLGGKGKSLIKLKNTAS